MLRLSILASSLALAVSTAGASPVSETETDSDAVTDQMALAVPAMCDPTLEHCTWQRTHGGHGVDKAYAVATLSDGGAMAVGTTRAPGQMRDDALVLRLDSSGGAVWRRVFGGWETEQALGVAAAADAGALVVGQTRSEGAGESDLWAARLGSDGSTLWRLVHGGPGNDRARGATAIDDDGFVVVGFASQTAGQGRDVSILRLDALGSILWEQTLGGAGTDGASSVAMAADGDILVVGHHSSPVGGFDLWAARLDGDGLVRWQRSFDRSVFDAGTGIVELADGSIAVLGITQPGARMSLDTWVLRLDADGSVIWQRILDGGGNDPAWAIVGGPSGELVVAAATDGRGAGSSDVWLMGLEVEDGSLRWERIYGGAAWDRPTGLVRRADGSLLVVGYTTSSGAGYEDWLLMGLDPEGLF